MSNVPASQQSSLADIIAIAHQLAAVDKLRLIRILAEDLDTGESIEPFEPGRTYYLATPYEAFGSAKRLADALSTAPADNEE